MKKVIFEEINRCDDCPYFRYQQDNDYAYTNDGGEWYECGHTDKILIGMKEFLELKDFDPFEFPIPDWCPLEDYDLFHKAIDVVKKHEDDA